MHDITEVASDLYRISTFVPQANLQFNQFLVLDEEPLLFHTGMRGLFPTVKEAVARLVDPTRLRWIGFSHFEADECGALHEWQAVATQATAICTFVGKIVSVDDVVAVRPARAMTDGETLSTGKYRFRFLQTPHVPHGWDAGLLYEETQRTLLCTDLFHQNGNVEPMTSSDVVGRFREALQEYQHSPLAFYMPYFAHTEHILQRLSALKPRTLATMHGSTFVGDGEQAIKQLAVVMRDLLGPQ